MSSNHNLGSNSPSGEIEHISHLSNNIGTLFLNDEYSDVILVVEGEKFHSHKAILASRSDYFRALLFGGMKESSQSEIELKSTPLKGFEFLLKYVYTGQMSLSSLKEDTILDILTLANQYGFLDLELAISEYLEAILKIKNVCMIFDVASLYQHQHLQSVCYTFMDLHAPDVISHETFYHLSPAALKKIISRDSFCAPEEDIFKAVCEWHKLNPGHDASSILEEVRLSLMDTNCLLNVVRPTNLVSSDCILDAIKTKTESRDMDLNYRGYLIVDENVAQTKYGAQVLAGEMKKSLLDGDTAYYDMERGYTRHTIDDGSGILIELGMQCIINHVKMLLWDRDPRSYSYCIEVSKDQEDWVRIIDHTKYHCRSWQYLYFHPRVVKYIKIIGTYNTVNRVFHVVSVEAFYTSKLFEISEGLYVPKANVATIGMHASVIEGVSRTRNALLNGDTKNYNWDNGYTCHQLGSGAIVLQLAQPYMLSSLRLLLWDCDDRSYSYYIESSVNYTSWKMIVDKTKEPCRSWQTVYFDPCPVVYLRIVGTNNTANEVFHCVHFECPAQVESELLLTNNTQHRLQEEER